MDTNDYYALLAPAFLVLMTLEAWAAHRQGIRAYALPDTLANLSCGLGQILIGIFTGGFLLATYDEFSQNFAIIRWSEGSWAPWVIAFVGVDFCYYWFHRGSHSINLFWAIHSVHHQSKEMNISVAVRQPWFSDFTSLFFFWPLPFLGVSREAFFLAVGVLSLYEALMHTRLVKRTGAWGWVFNTPSFHRLHHAVGDAYRDHNFGSTLILWDRLFGTFVRERSTPSFGTDEPFETWNPLWAQAKPVLALFRASWRERRWIDALRLWIMPPGWRPPEDSAPLSPSGAVKGRQSMQERRPVSRHIAAYALVQQLIIGFISFTLLWRGQHLSLVESAVLVAPVLWTTGTIGNIFDRSPSAFSVEFARLVTSVGIGVAAAAYVHNPLIGWSTAGIAIVSAGWLFQLRKEICAQELNAPIDR